MATFRTFSLCFKWGKFQEKVFQIGKDFVKEYFILESLSFKVKLKLKNIQMDQSANFNRGRCSRKMVRLSLVENFRIGDDSLFVVFTE